MKLVPGVEVFKEEVEGLVGRAGNEGVVARDKRSWLSRSRGWRSSSSSLKNSSSLSSSPADTGSGAVAAAVADAVSSAPAAATAASPVGDVAKFMTGALV